MGGGRFPVRAASSWQVLSGDAENLHPASSIQLTCSLHTEHSTAVLLGGPWVASRGENVSSRSWDGDSA